MVLSGLPKLANVRWPIEYYREEVAKQEAKKKYQAMTAAGKTDEAKADMARLAIIRAQREEAAKKRELQQKGNINTNNYAFNAN